MQNKEAHYAWKFNKERHERSNQDALYTQIKLSRNKIN